MDRASPGRNAGELRRRPQQDAVRLDSSPLLASGEDKRGCRGGGTTGNSLMSIVMEWSGGDAVPEAKRSFGV